MGFRDRDREFGLTAIVRESTGGRKLVETAVRMVEHQGLGTAAALLGFPTLVVKRVRSFLAET